MAIQQIVSISTILQGDGVATVFTFAMNSLYQTGAPHSVAFSDSGVLVPSSVLVSNPPVPVTSATVDANGNITITLTSALGSGVRQNFVLELIYNSGAAVSSSPTQFSNVRELKDSGRTYLSFTADGVAAPTAEALATFTSNKGGVATVGVTSYTVTVGKTLRLQSITGNLVSNSGTQTIKIRVRSAVSVLATSPIIWLTFGTGASGATNPFSVNWPDGIEIAGSQQVGVTLVSGNASNTCTFSLNGYEY